MKMRIVLLIIAIFLMACNAEVKRVQLPSHSELRVVDCHRADFCYTCSMNMDGQYSCGLKFSTLCEGHWQATILVQPYEVTYESGIVRRFEDTVTQEYHGRCEP